MFKTKIIDALSKVEVFAGLTRDDLKVVSKACRRIHYNEGETLIEMGKPSAGFYVLTKGKVKVILPERIEGGGLRLTDEHRFEMEQALTVATAGTGSHTGSRTAQVMAEALKGLSFVGPTYTHTTLETPQTGDSIADLFRHSYTPGRAGGLLSRYGVEMWWAENTLAWGMPFGTTHGSPFYYDRWVPLILMGPGIEAGTVEDPVGPMDLAPTLAYLAGVPFPDDLNGVPLPGGGS